MVELSRSVGANSIGACTIVTGLITAGIQSKRQQCDALAINLAETCHNQGLAQALLKPLPVGRLLARLRDQGSAYQQTTIAVCAFAEAMELQLYERVAPFDLVLNVSGGVVSIIS